MNAIVDQGSDVNVMPLSTYMKLTDERPAETDIRLSLASHSYIYPLGIADDVLVEVSEHVHPMYLVILDIKEDEKRPFILGTPFLTTAKAVIKFDKGTITLNLERPHYDCEKASLRMGQKDKTSPRKGDEVNRWRNKNFKNERPALVKIGDEKDDEGKVTKFLTKNKEEIFTDARDGVRIYPDGVASPVIRGLILYVGNKMHKAFPLPVMEFSLPEEVPTASKESSHCQKKKEATAVKIALLLKSRRNCQSKSYDSYAKSDLYTMSLDDLYNHLKVYESEVQKKSETNSQNMAFISSAKHSRGNEDVNTASVFTTSIIDINQIDKDDMEEMDIKWNMALLSMKADKF
nr:hypothetical protein [Tanacetum cinerariifolium]